MSSPARVRPPRGRPAAFGIRALARASAICVLVCTLAWAGLAAWSHRAARADEAAHPPVGRFVEVDGARVHYLRLGPLEPSAAARRSPTLVFLHGAGTSLLDAVPALLPRLAARFEVVAIDRPGHGYSERGQASVDTGWVDPLTQARRIAGALEAIGVRRPIWVGHSWAGAVTLAALAHLPEPDAAAGVVLAGALYPWPGDGSSRPAEIAAVPLLGAVFAHAFVEPLGRGALAPAVRGAFAPESVPAGYIEATGLRLSLRPSTFRDDATDRTRLSGWLRSASPAWSDITRPLLSISGTADRVVPPARHAERLRTARPTTRLVRLPGAGHGLIHTRTDRIATEIRAFADEIGRGSYDAAIER